jgi:predicted dehydrogenase
MHNAAKMCRRQGRIILVGITGLNLSRDDFYEKEITFQVSSSYGPGRYDENYESGNDYPIGFVRWTAQRNFEAVLDMISQGSLNVDKLITHSFDFNNALQAYKILAEPSGSLGILLKYGDGTFQNNKEKIELNKTLHDNKSPRPLEKINVGFIGTGNYANNILMPAFNNTGVTLQTAISKNGLSSFISGRKNKFNYCSNNEADILSDDNINLVVISTRHDTHAELVLKAIKAKKHIFLEKPLCLNSDELNLIRKASINYTSNLMIGFNRRFSPLSQKAKSLLDELSGPKSINYTINSGEIPLDHWTQDLNIGGGRIIGECCHFIDLLYFLVGSPIENYNKFTMKDKSGDTHTISLTFNDGSIGTINYFCNGSKSYPKEKLEMFCGGKVLELNNFRELRGFGWNNFKKLKLWKQDKGQRNCVADFVSSISEGKRSPIPLEQIFDIASVTLDIDTNC